MAGLIFFNIDTWNKLKKNWNKASHSNFLDIISFNSKYNLRFTPILVCFKIGGLLFCLFSPIFLSFICPFSHIIDLWHFYAIFLLNFKTVLIKNPIFIYLCSFMCYSEIKNGVMQLCHKWKKSSSIDRTAINKSPSANDINTQKKSSEVPSD